MLPKKIDIDESGVYQLTEAVNALIDHLSQNEVKEEWPQENDRYWFVGVDGLIRSDIWCNSLYENDMKDFLGIYRTQKEAEAARDRIKELLKV